MSYHTSCGQRVFSCVYLHDVSKCLVAHPASIELFSSIIWLEVPKQFGNFITLYISNVFNCVWSLSRNVFKTTGQLNSFKQLFFCFYLLMILQNVSSHILQAKGFYPVCIFAWNFWLFRLTKVSLHIPQAKGFSPVCIFSWHFRMSLGTSCRQMAFLLCVSSHDVSGCLWRHPAGKELFSRVFLRLTFQNVSSHILQT